MGNRNQIQSVDVEADVGLNQVGSHILIQSGQAVETLYQVISINHVITGYMANSCGPVRNAVQKGYTKYGCGYSKSRRFTTTADCSRGLVLNPGYQVRSRECPGEQEALAKLAFHVT